MFKDNIEQHYQEWLISTGLSPSTARQAFEAGFKAGSLSNDEAQLVVLARQEIALEAQKQLMNKQFESIRKAKEAVLTALGELDKLRGNSWMY